MNKNLNLKVPVLLVAFNRPTILKQTIQYIREAKPQKLYVAIDGPRENIEGEAAIVNQVREIVQNIDWPCKTHYKFNEINKGAEITVSSAISWVFEKEEYAIILEDDIVAPISFFRFSQEMLIKYKNDKRIGIISGNNFTPIPLKEDSDYFFAKYAHSWGWATWKRVWDNFDLDIDVKVEHLKYDFLNTISNSKAERRYYKNRFKNMKKRGKGNNTWDSVANYISRINYRINIVPKVNLTSNIGVYGLHARGKSEFHNVPYDESFIVKKHPEKVKLSAEYDKHHFKEHILKYQKNIAQRIINKFSRLLFGKKVI